MAIQATYPGTGEGGTTLVFAPRNYKQRPGLLLLNGVVYTAFSSHCDIGTYHGWLMGYDAKTLKQVSVYNNTPNGNEGSFWEGGAAPAADANGNIYLVAGNGTFDFASGGGDLGESYIKLSSAGTLKVVDYFAPFNFSELNDGDVDVGSAGVALVGDEAGSASHRHLLVGAGKEGRIYVLDRDNLGKWQAGSDSQIVASLPDGDRRIVRKSGVLQQDGLLLWLGRSPEGVFAGKRNARHVSEFSDERQGSDIPAACHRFRRTAHRMGSRGCWNHRRRCTLSMRPIWDTSFTTAIRTVRATALGSYVKYSVPTIANGKVYAGTQRFAGGVRAAARSGDGGRECRERTSGHRGAGIDHFDLWHRAGARYMSGGRVSAAFRHWGARR